MHVLLWHFHLYHAAVLAGFLHLSAGGEAPVGWGRAVVDDGLSSGGLAVHRCHGHKFFPLGYH